MARGGAAGRAGGRPATGPGPPARPPVAFAAGTTGATAPSMPGCALHARCPAPSAPARPAPPRSVALGVMAGVVQGKKAAKYLEFAANMTRACYQVCLGQGCASAVAAVGRGRQPLAQQPCSVLDASPCARAAAVQPDDHWPGCGAHRLPAGGAGEDEH